MKSLTLDGLRKIMRDCAGENESTDLNVDIGDVCFMDLGYDSLALLETASRLEREFDVTLDDDSVTEDETPNALIQLVNARSRASSQP
ncbi:acyl carrier protein [Jatrophihabitans lederbergiae]|uniref:Phosphopantetheine-binding protein n=1 Tax=Jatrophihabitans lederbergiae TaxID=3075547 RepID=A0ABU2JHZ2_9ACTN|nr:phosphopantetheine-binding protein [Jatrophihabitans sp. DSM 44399]MDT0264532.1 phosphopantetheine-binding protein [Jatrophihabitans sp. DSM 44399]